MMDVLCLFTRTPSIGSCKTRLIPLLGETGAQDAHVELVESQIARLAKSKQTRSLWVTRPSDQVDRWADMYKASVEFQEGADLGQRMLHSFVHEFRHGANYVCLIGGDCPEITQVYVDQAFAELQEHAVVIGPTEDGGYGLIALREPNAELFRNISWSTPQVLGETLQITAALGLSVKLLDKIWDVDTPTDWRRYKGR